MLADVRGCDDNLVEPASLDSLSDAKPSSELLSPGGACSLLGMLALTASSTDSALSTLPLARNWPTGALLSQWLDASDAEEPTRLLVTLLSEPIDGNDVRLSDFRSIGRPSPLWRTWSRKCSTSSRSQDLKSPVTIGSSPWQRTFCARMWAVSSRALKQLVASTPDCTARFLDSGRTSMRRSCARGYSFRTSMAV